MNKVTALAVESLLLEEYSDIYLTKPTKKDLQRLEKDGIDLSQRSSIHGDWVLFFSPGCPKGIIGSE